MTVLTLSNDDLHHHAIDLLSVIEKDKFLPDVIIGIATGGIYISRPIEHQLRSQKWEGKYYEVKLSRASTQRKEKLNINKLLMKLPYIVLNQLRTLEVLLFEHFKHETYDLTKEDSVHLSSHLVDDIKKFNSILLIDDAIDTGSTIVAISNVIKRINPNIAIKVAVLTVTHKNPYIEPDYTLYNRVLLRCPWAMDYRGEDKIG